MDKEYPILFKTIKEIADTPFEYDPGAGLKDDYEDTHRTS